MNRTHLCSKVFLSRVPDDRKKGSSDVMKSGISGICWGFYVTQGCWRSSNAISTGIIFQSCMSIFVPGKDLVTARIHPKMLYIYGNNQLLGKTFPISKRFLQIACNYILHPVQHKLCKTMINTEMLWFKEKNTTDLDMEIVRNIGNYVIKSLFE